MAETMENRVQHAVQNLKQAIKDFSKFYELPDERRYPPPAPASKIAALSEALDRPLPPSFRAFLAIHNGFPEVDGNSDILTAGEIARLNRDGSKDLRTSVAQRLNTIEARDIVVIGRSSHKLSVIFFDLARISDDGEWTVVEFDEDEGLDGTHPDFAKFLESTAENMRAAIEEEDGDWRDLLDPNI
jgi:hypothetical protein